MKKVGKRFLEPQTEGVGSTIQWSVRTSKQKRVVMGISANVVLSDCHRTIDWSFDTYSERDVRRVLAKLRRVRQEIDQFSRALLQSASEYKKSAPARRTIRRSEKRKMAAALRRYPPPSR